MRKYWSNLRDDFAAWRAGWYFYIERKFHRFGLRFETYKDQVVDLLMARRGSYQRPFLHFSLSILVVVGIISAPTLANAYPGSLPNALAEFTPPSAVVTSLDFTDYGVQTQVSEKPRDQVITHVVVSGETLGSIASRYGVSIDSIKWTSNLRRDVLSVGQEVKIPPVTGIVHKVKSGDTIYSIAKLYKTDAHKIVNFPSNAFAD